jgi:hypothetical protein
MIDQLKKQIEDLKAQIELNKLQQREEATRLRVLREQRKLIREAKMLQKANEIQLRGSHTAHPKGSDHHKAKNWNVWERVSDGEYEFLGTYGSIGEIARELGKTYMATWGMMRRWQKLSSGAEEYKYNKAKERGLQYRIEEA